MGVDVICVKIKRVSDTGVTSVWRVTAPTLLRALELFPGEVIFPLDEKEFFSPRLTRGFEATEVVEGVRKSDNPI
jgi:hypothetical protein